MLCGYLHPYFSNLLTTIDGMAPARKAVVRGSVLACSAVAGYFYFVHVYCLPKIEYNKVSATVKSSVCAAEWFHQGMAEVYTPDAHDNRHC
jgi:hypothetical protein